jgi:hypothetical protein
MVIMVTMRVLVNELVYQDSRGWTLLLESFPVWSAWVPMVTSCRVKP